MQGLTAWRRCRKVLDLGQPLAAHATLSLRTSARCMGHFVGTGEGHRVVSRGDRVSHHVLSSEARHSHLRLCAATDTASQVTPKEWRHRVLENPLPVMVHLWSETRVARRSATLASILDDIARDFEGKLEALSSVLPHHRVCAAWCSSIINTRIDCWSI